MTEGSIARPNRPMSARKAKLEAERRAYLMSDDEVMAEYLARQGYDRSIAKKSLDVMYARLSRKEVTKSLDALRARLAKQAVEAKKPRPYIPDGHKYP